MPIPGGGIATYPIAGGPIPLVGLVGDFVIDGFDIQDCVGMFVQEINYDDINEIDIDTFDSPQTDGGGVAGYFVNGKSLDVSMVLKADTEANLNVIISNIKKAFFGENKLLQINVDGVVRNAYVNLTSLTFNKDPFKKNLLTDVNATFKAMNDFFADIPVTNSFIGVTADATEDIINTGEKRTNGRIVMIFGAGIVGLTSIDILLNGYTTSISETIADGDILIFDGEERVVTLNGTSIDYDGPIDLELLVGSNLITWNFNGGATFTVDTTVIYKSKFL